MPTMLIPTRSMQRDGAHSRAKHVNRPAALVPRGPILSFIGYALVALIVTACGVGEEQAADQGPSVALLTSGPVSDAGWHAGAYEGLQMIRDSLGYSVSHQQTRTPAEFDEAFISYGSAGYDLIFAHGFEYQDAADRAGSQYPEVMFIVSGGSRASDNVVPLVFHLQEASYLAGMAAGGVTSSGIVGMVGGVEIPSAKGTFIAFEAGVKAVRPDATVLETFTGSWEDVAAAKEASVAQLRRGADVIIHNVDAASFGLFQAVREARGAGNNVWAMGMNRDQNGVAPDVIIGSAVIDIPATFLLTARRWAVGELGGRPLYTGLQTGAVEFVPNPSLDVIPDGILERVQAARAAILQGELDVPRIEFVEDPGQDSIG